MEIVDDTVIADPAPPCRALALESLDVTAEGIFLHGEQGPFNARLISCRQFSEFFLRGAGDLEVPGHCVSSY